MYLLVVAVTISFIVLTLCLLLWKKVGGRCCLEAPGPVLLLTAHPDDECMFFSPTVQALTRKTPHNVYLLCLSKGNYYGRGSVREEELHRSATLLGVPPGHTQVVDDERLPDDPAIKWGHEVVLSHVCEAIEGLGIQTIITFDEGGVSGHPNHTALCSAMRAMCSTPKYSTVSVLLLESVHVGRKYAGLLDLPFSLCSRYHTVGTLTSYLNARSAMRAHRSQYLWFRRLYICFSRYMVINTFRELR